MHYYMSSSIVDKLFEFLKPVTNVISYLFTKERSHLNKNGFLFFIFLVFTASYGAVNMKPYYDDEQLRKAKETEYKFTEITLTILVILTFIYLVRFLLVKY